MFRIFVPRSRGQLPLHILELIVASSTRHTSYNIHRRLVTKEDSDSATTDSITRLTTLLHSDHDAKFTDAEAETHNLRLSSLRLALRTWDPILVRDAYEDLVNYSSSQALLARDYETISRILSRHFSNCRRIEDVMVGASEMAIEAAARGHIDGLRSCLLLHLKSGNVQDVPLIYSKFELTRGAITQGSVLPARKSEGTEVMDEGTLLPVGPSWNNPGVADLVLTVIAACATENRFEDALHTFLSTPMTVRIARAKAQGFCNIHLSHDRALSNKVQEWSQELVLLRLVSRPSSLNNYISHLGNDKHIIALQRLYTSVVSECKKVGGRLELEQSLLCKTAQGTAERKVVVMPSDGWSTFMQAFFKCHRVDLVEKLWDDVQELGLSPNRRMWSALLDGYGRHGHCKQAMIVWNRMLEEGVEPDEISYGAMVSAYFLAHRPNEGFALFEQFRRGLSETAEGKQNLSAHAMLPLYNIVLHGLCTNTMDDRARSILKEMIEHGPRPDIVSYNTFLRHYGRIGDMKGLAGVLRALKPAGVQPDAHSFTTVLSALYKAGKRDAHTKTIEIMHMMGVQPNAAMYSTIVDFLVRQGGEENFRKAGDLVQLMEQNPNKDTRPNEVTYTSLLAGLHRDRSISAQNVKIYTAELLGRMYKNGKLPNRTTYHILIKACLENPELEGLGGALGYYREMEKRGIKLLNDTWYVILSGLFRRGDLAMAEQILNDMFKKGHEPDQALSTLVGRLERQIALRAQGHI